MKLQKAYLFSTLPALSLTFFALSCTNSSVYADVNYYVLSVGNANFTYLQKNNVATVIDAGIGRPSAKNNNLDLIDLKHNQWYWEEKAKTDWVVEFMKNTGVTVIDSIFITHKHADHYNAVKALTESFEVKTINAPIFGETLKDELKDFEGKVETRFLKTYKSQGYTFTNVTAYASKETLKEIKSESQDINDTSMVLQFSANGKNFLQPGDMTNQILPNDKKFMQKILARPTDFLLAAHHGSGNSVTEVYDAMGEKGFSPDQIVISGTSDIMMENQTTDWSEFSGGHLFPAEIVISNLINNFKDNGLKSKSIHLTGSGGTIANYQSKYLDTENYNKSYVYKSVSSNNYDWQLLPIDQNITFYQKNTMQNSCFYVQPFVFQFEQSVYLKNKKI